MTTNPSRPAHFWRAYVFETAGAFLAAWRTPAFYLPSLLFPLGFFALFAIALPHDAQSAARSLANFGIIGVMGPALFGFGVAIAVERESGALALQRLSPQPFAVFLAARLSMCVLFAIQALILLDLLAAFGAGVRLSHTQWFALAGVQLLGAPILGALGLGLGLRLAANAAGGVINVVFLIFSALGGLWLPSQILPKPVQTFGQFLPSEHLGALARLAIGVGHGSPGGHLAALAAFGLGFAIFAGRGFRRAFQRV